MARSEIIDPDKPQLMWVLEVKHDENGE